MDSIQIVEGLGYYHPSSANWSYRVHMIVDQKGARLYKENFGGDSRLRARLESEGHKVIRLYAGVGSNARFMAKDINKMPDIESYQAHKNY